RTVAGDHLRGDGAARRVDRVERVVHARVGDTELVPARRTREHVIADTGHGVESRRSDGALDLQRLEVTAFGLAALRWCRRRGESGTAPGTDRGVERVLATARRAGTGGRATGSEIRHARGVTPRPVPTTPPANGYG